MAARNPVGRVGAGSRHRFQLLVSLCLLGVAVWFLFSALEREIRRAEQESARLVLNQLRGALVVKGAEIRLTEGTDFRGWAGSNPFLWLDPPPTRYAGECDRLPQPGQWCYRPSGRTPGEMDTNGKRGQLIFLPRQPITLGERQGSREAVLRWIVGVEFTDRNGNGRLDDNDRQTGLWLQPVENDHQRNTQDASGRPEL